MNRVRWLRQNRRDCDQEIACAVTNFATGRIAWSMTPTFDSVVEGKDYSFPEEETKVLAFWGRIDAFREQLRRTSGREEFVFFDGPPFATGLPHYGHILAGTIKDIVTRYASTTGYHVERRFGWDCHGLPVEHEIDKAFAIKGKADVLAMGIDKYNEECRSIVMRYSSEWRKTITRVGRWIDFDNDYKTLDPTFMESVWWVFKRLHEKGLVYRGFKVMPYSTACNTPLSNFEAGLDYRDVSDPAVLVKFPVINNEKTYLVAWTTTPWTLPANMALCVNPDFDYCYLQNPLDEMLIVADLRKSFIPGATKKNKIDTLSDGWRVVKTVKGSELAGLQYTPIFDCFVAVHSARAFVVTCDKYVTSDSGTGIVHQAPAYGEDDYRVCLENKIILKGEALPDLVDANGCFTEQAPQPVAGMYIKDADKILIQLMKDKRLLLDSARIVHSYPFCWRSKTPLIYRAVSSYFVRVEQIKSELLHNNRQTKWVPAYVQEKRFHNWIEGARDWAISRNRYWGTPIPIWQSLDGEETVVVGSIEELERLTGVANVQDIHRHKIDHLTIPSSRGENYPPLRRVEDVFDCWFESGSMPYAQQHYPFENCEMFEKNFPADFIAEGLDQTRGWFYTLMVLSTALFDRPAFKNLICNGLVLAADGKKMSKSLNNYIGIADAPDEMFGKLMSISDDLMWRYFELLSFRPLSEIEQFKQQIAEGANPRDIKFLLGEELVARFHDAAAATAAREAFIARFQKGAIPDEMDEVSLQAVDGQLAIGNLLKEAGLVTSTSEALRMIKQGAVKMDGEKLENPQTQIAAGSEHVYQVGKRRFARVRVIA